jgi:hypothetical protein
MNVIEGGLIPLFDLSDGVFAAFRLREGDYCLFNIADGIAFLENKSVFEILGNQWASMCSLLLIGKKEHS